MKRLLCFLMVFYVLCFSVVAVEDLSEDPVVDDPVVEDPVVEDPVVEDPVVEDPVVDDPVVEDPVVDDPVVDDPVVDDPVVDDPVVDDPVVDDSVVDDPVVDDPAGDSSGGSSGGGGGGDIINEITEIYVMPTDIPVDAAITDISVMSVSPITPSDTSGMKAVLLSLIGDYDPVIVEYEYESYNGSTSYLREVQPDYVWLCSVGLFAIMIYCLFRLGGALLRV